MSYQNISEAIAAADKTAIQQAVQTIKAKLPFLVNLNSTERKNLRKMGTVRSPYVQAVYNAAVNNPGAVASGFSLTEYGKDVQLHKDLNDIYVWLKPLFEGVEDTNMGVGNELMKQTDECYGYLKTAAKKSSNQALTSTVNAIAAQLKQHGKTITPAPVIA